MFALQEQILRQLLESLQGGEKIADESQEVLEKLAVLSRTRPLAPIPSIIHWYNTTSEKIRRKQGKPAILNILQIACVILVTILSSSTQSYQEDEVGEEFQEVLLFYWQMLLLVGDNANLMRLVKKLAASLAHVSFDSFLEYVRNQLESASLRPAMHEALIVSLQEVRLKIYPEEEFNRTIRLISTLVKYFGLVQGLKEPYVQTLSTVLFSITSGITAEVNLPLWCNLMEETLWPAARALFDRPKQQGIFAHQLLVAILCVSRKEFFLHQQAQLITEVVKRVRERDLKPDALLAVAQLWWVYCFKHAESWSSLGQHAERLHEKLLFPSKKHPEVPGLLQLHWMWISLAKLGKQAIQKQLLPVLNSCIGSLTAQMPRSTGSSLGSIGSAILSSLSFQNIIPEPVAHERVLQAITAYILYLHNQIPEFPTVFSEVAIPSTPIHKLNNEPEHVSICKQIYNLLIILDQSHPIVDRIVNSMPALFSLDVLPLMIRWIEAGQKRSLEALQRVIRLNQDNLNAQIHAQLLLALSKHPDHPNMLLASLKTLLHHASFSPIDTIALVSVYVLSVYEEIRQLGLECLQLLRSFIAPDTKDLAQAQMFHELPNLDGSVEAFSSAPTVAAMLKPHLNRHMRQLSVFIEKFKFENDDNSNAESWLKQWQRYAAFFNHNGGFTERRLRDVFEMTFIPYINHPVQRIRQASLQALGSLNPAFVEALITDIWAPLARPLSADLTNPKFRFTRKAGQAHLRRQDWLKCDLTQALCMAISAGPFTSCVHLVRKFLIELTYFCMQVDAGMLFPRLRYWACRCMSSYLRQIRGSWDPSFWPPRLHQDVWKAVWQWQCTLVHPGTLLERTASTKDLSLLTSSTSNNHPPSLPRSLSADNLMKTERSMGSSLPSQCNPELEVAYGELMLELSFNLPARERTDALFEWLDTLQPTSLCTAICSLFHLPDNQPILLPIALERAYTLDRSGVSYARSLFEVVNREISHIPVEHLVVMSLLHNSDAPELGEMMLPRDFRSGSKVESLLEPITMPDKSPRVHARSLSLFTSASKISLNLEARDAQLSFVSQKDEALLMSIRLSNCVSLFPFTELVILTACARLPDIELLTPWIGNLIFEHQLKTVLGELVAKAPPATHHRLWQQFCLWPHLLKGLVEFLLENVSSPEWVHAMALVEPEMIAETLLSFCHPQDLRNATKALEWMSQLNLKPSRKQESLFKQARYALGLTQDWPRSPMTALEWALADSLEPGIRARSWLAYRHIRRFSNADLLSILEKDSWDETCLCEMIETGCFDDRLLAIKRPAIVASLIRVGKISPSLHLEHPLVVSALMEEVGLDVIKFAPLFLPILLPRIFSDRSLGEHFARWIRTNHHSDDPCDSLLELSALVTRLNPSTAVSLARLLPELGIETERIITALHECPAEFVAAFLPEYSALFPNCQVESLLSRLYAWPDCVDVITRSLCA